MKESKILKVLEKVPSGTKLYSTAFGKLELKSIIEAWGNKRIELIEGNKDRRVYLPDGRYRKGGEITLYPSREMRDWNKFAWKKGDVLVNKDRDAHIIFEKFTDDTYTTFTGRHYYMNDGKNKDAARVCCNVSTECYTLETENVAKYYINGLEKRLGGKLNHNTLEIEKPKFKDGDILTCLDAAFHESSTFIFEREYEYGYSYYAGIEISGQLYINPGSIWCGKCGNIRYATSEEKTKLFDALAKEGKHWNSENKIFEDIKTVPKKENATYKKKNDISEHKFKPFEKVLCRDYEDSVWEADLFGFKVKNETETLFKYRCVGNIYKCCIPYKGNEHLLGTSKNLEEE